jgi:YVTN family beta-propeller protein
MYYPARYRTAPFTGVLATILCMACSVRHPSVVRDQMKGAPGVTRENALVGLQKDSTYFVSTSQIINPVGQTIAFPGRPTDLVFDNDEKLMAVKNLGDIVFFDVSERKIIQTLKMPGGGNTYTGIAWSGSGEDQKIWVTDTRGYLRSAKKNRRGLFVWTDEFLLPPPVKKDKNGADPGGLTVIDKRGSDPDGFAIDQASGLIYVALSRNNTVCVVNMHTGLVEDQIPVGVAPYAVILQKGKAYVSNLGGRQPVAGDKTALSSGTPTVIDPKTGVASSGTISVIDLSLRKVVKEIDVHLHPSGMTLTPDGSGLYVANANSDIISVIDTKKDEVIKNINAKPLAELPLGSMPNALAITPDGKTLYVANGGNNVLAVFDLKTDSLTGLIPTGWYPGAVLINRAGTQLIVGNVKGFGGNAKRSSTMGFNSHDYLGTLSFIPVPDKQLLKEYTSKAIFNIGLPNISRAFNTSPEANKIVAVPTHPDERSVFKHVLYIIKENRTYDQILGDLPQGNGDTALCQFGRKVTPNIHALSEQFVLLDNTYCNGINSADGHQWTDEGLATVYLEKSFGGFVRSYPCCGGEDPLAYASSGFIWDYVLHKNLSFRDYGEFVQAKVEPEKATWKEQYSDFLNKTGKIKIKSFTELSTLDSFLCPTFVGFPESMPDVYRADEFIKELHASEESGNFPNFMIMLLPCDHTAATAENYPTPRAMVADNDLALGRMVEAISKSKFWKETAIFVVEDDAQAGLDHVDGRRTEALCISPYTKRGVVVSKMYNQNSILRTIELILGLPPMNQFDLLATPMVDCFVNEPDFTPYTALPNQIPLDEMNPPVSMLKGKQKYWAKKSMKIPLTEVDLDDPKVMNRIIWHSAKGYDVPYPKDIR